MLIESPDSTMFSDFRITYIFNKTKGIYAQLHSRFIYETLHMSHIP